MNLELKNISVSLAEEKKQILKNINLTVKEGEVHLLNGENGSGKSSLVATIMGDPKFEITKGKITSEFGQIDLGLREDIKKEEIKIEKESDKLFRIELNDVPSNLRSRLGIYLANQHPVEVPGVSLMQFLRITYNLRKEKKDQLPVFKFRKIVQQKADLINYPTDLLKRNLNEGFSGGEKKKTEILQMLIIEPSLILLDEIDSGLDVKAREDVFSGIAMYKKEKPETSMIIISHYEKVLEHLKPQFIHTIKNGIIEKTE